MGGCVTEDQAIAHAQYLDLDYSQFSTLYEILPDAPRPYLYRASSKSRGVPPIDGFIGSISQISNKSALKQKSISNTTYNPPLKPSSNLGKTSEINVVLSTTAGKTSKGKKKGKGKEKPNTLK